MKACIHILRNIDHIAMEMVSVGKAKMSPCFRDLQTSAQALLRFLPSTASAHSVWCRQIHCSGRSESHEAWRQGY